MNHERLEIHFKLRAAGAEHLIPPGNVVACDVELTSHGLRASVDFWLADPGAHGGAGTEAMLAALRGPEVIAAELSLRGLLTIRGEEAPPLPARGVVLRRRLEETLLRQAGRAAPILLRRYRLELADPAAALWSQHFPCELYTGRSIAEVIQAQALEGAGPDLRVATRFAWEELTRARPVLCLHLDPAAGASFYDFVLWCVHERGGVFTYDHEAAVYRLTGEKPELHAGAPARLRDDEVARLVADFPEIDRADAQVLNSYAESAEARRIAQAQAVPGVRRDVLVRTASGAEVDQRAAWERARRVTRGPELVAELHGFPRFALLPGARVTLPAEALWSPQALEEGEALRLTRVRASARRSEEQGAAAGDAATAVYAVELSAAFERDGEPHAPLPPFRAPRYPAHVEAKVVSERGADDEITYAIHQREGEASGGGGGGPAGGGPERAVTPRDAYKVRVPLWGDQTLLVPYEPQQGSGQIYLPAYKGARVLLELDLEGGRIVGLLDWREGAALDDGTQGGQILFGRSSATDRTRVRHTYAGSVPTFEIDRTHGADWSRLRLEEGAATLRLAEAAQAGQPEGGAAPGTLACGIRLDKAGGITLTVEKADGSIRQTVAMDGTSITLEVAGQGATSSIVQREDSVAIRCKAFTVEAETINCAAKEDATCESEGTLSLRSKRDLEISAMTKLAAKGELGAELSGLTLDLAAKTRAKLEGGVELALAGAARAELKAVAVMVQGGATATVQGSALAALQGGRVKVG